MSRKLTESYGTPTDISTKYHFIRKWTDQYGNYIQIFLTAKKNYVALSFMAADGEGRLDEMAEAIIKEKAAEDEQKLKVNENNKEGL